MTADLFAWAAEHPPFQRHSPTSKAAAEAIKPRIGPMHRAILEFLKDWSLSASATDEEMQRGIPMAQNTQRPRRRELQTAGLIIDSGRTRATQSGRQAVVWIIATGKAE